MTSDEVRSAFLSFFEDKGHEVVPGSSLIPHGDPTLLLTSAGMVQFKPYFLGRETPPSPRLASCQKCFRTTDIEAVGDPTHNTFFEMLGNFSIGDYFKQETINWAFEFITEHLRIPHERLWVSVFLDDDEAFKLWRQLGIPEERILRFGEEHNFWGPAGSSGPCGPDNEVFYDFGEEVGCGKPGCGPNCDCGRFVEISTLVFMQYNQDKDGRRSPLPRPSVDTGSGLERITAVVQGKTSIYETDLFAPLMQRISELSGSKYGADKDADNAMRIVAEHSRGIAFLVTDGVLPDNEGQGYVLRRLLRRASLFGLRLGIDKPFLAETAGVTIEQMKHIYPELEQRRDFIMEVAGLEEARFSETLKTGLELLDGIMEHLAGKKGGVIPGKEAFKLYDTYGFPVELTTEVASRQGLIVDMAGFEREMEKQRDRAKASHKFGLAEKDKIGSGSGLDIKNSSFVGYSNLKQATTVLGLLVGNDSVKTVEEGQEAEVILGDTPFYGEMGGQVGDTGEIRGSKGSFSVTDTVRVPPDVIVHRGQVTKGSLSVGDEVEAAVDVKRRLDIARNHTATHLLQAALRQVLGEHIQQRGSLVAPERFSFDFSHLKAMAPGEIQEVQRIINNRIRQNLAVYDEDVPYKQAIEEGAIALFDEKYGDVVRVLKIGRPPVSTELCGGTHVTSTGEIGFIHILSEHSIGAGLRRIEAVTGRGAEEYINMRLANLQETAEYLDTELGDVLNKVSSLVTQLNWERKQKLILERGLAKKETESLLSQAEVVGGVRFLAARVDSCSVPVLREMGDLLRDKLKSAVVVLGTVYEDRPAFIATVTPDLVDKGYSAGDIVKQVAGVTGGGGGGKARFAQAGGKDKNKVDEALRLVKDLIKSGGK
jgi:alanyl-tRNA synthetase